MSHVRSTLLQSSLATLREAGYLERWRTLIGDHASTIEQAIAPTWMDVSIAMAHYRACDALGMSPEEVDAIGQKVGDRLQNMLVGLGARTARATGFDPKSGVPFFERLFPRVFRGGSLAITQHGPKDLRIELRSMGVTHTAYFRQAYCGHIKRAAHFFGVRTVYVKQHRFDSAADTFIVSVAWV